MTRWTFTDTNHVHETGAPLYTCREEAVGAAVQWLADTWGIEARVEDFTEFDSARYPWQTDPNSLYWCDGAEAHVISVHAHTGFVVTFDPDPECGEPVAPMGFVRASAVAAAFGIDEGMLVQEVDDFTECVRTDSYNNIVRVRRC